MSEHQEPAMPVPQTPKEHAEAMHEMGQAVPRGKVPIRQLGRSDPPPVDTTQQRQSAVNDLYIQLAVDNERLQQMDPVVLEMLNQMRVLEIEMAVMKSVLLRRGLVSSTELQQARVEVISRMDAELQQMLASLGKRFQKP